jgi:hypothetical protein
MEPSELVTISELVENANVQDGMEPEEVNRYVNETMGFM